MSDLPVLAVVLALTGALLFAVGSVAQQSAAEGVDENALIGELIRSPRWWAGVVGDVGGYGFQAAALAVGSVLVVQPLIVSTLLFALPLSARFAGTRMTGRTWAAALALAAALVVFLIVGNPTEGAESAPLRHWAVPLLVVLAACVGAVAASAAPRVPAGARALLLGSACGALYGVAVALTKPVVEEFDEGVTAVLTGWEPWALVAAGLTGFYLQQRAFAAGSLSASLPAITIGEPLVASFLGFTVLDERLRVEAGGLVVVLVAVAVMVVTTIALSRGQAGAGAPAVTS
ncbi:DMT family transporter [Rhodococcus triatomae]